MSKPQSQIYNLPENPPKRKQVISKTQRTALEFMRDGGLLKYNRLTGQVVMVSKEGAYAGKLTPTSLTAMSNGGMVKVTEPPAHWNREARQEYYTISEAGRAALTATNTGAVLPENFEAKTPNPLAKLDAMIAAERCATIKYVTLDAGQVIDQRLLANRTYYAPPVPSHGIVMVHGKPVCACGAALKFDGYQVMAVLGFRQKLYTCTASGTTLGGVREPLAEDLAEEAAEHEYDRRNIYGQGVG